MDVSKIGPVSLNKINWRSLTAKEIIKYEQQGVDVPLQYLSWAQDFIASIYSDDKTTYEMAKSTPDRSAPTTSVTTEPEETTEEVNTENETNNSTPETSSTKETKSPEEMTADERYNQMIEEGASIYSIGKVFKNESTTRADQVSSINQQNTNIENISNDEVSNLENYMSDLISQINSIKSEINTLKNNKDDVSAMTKINRLQNQIKMMGNSGQQMLTSEMATLDGIAINFEENQEFAQLTNDYGNKTIEIGDRLKRIITLFGFGKRVKNAGKNAVSQGDSLIQSTTQAQNTNNQNKSTVNSLISNLSAQSGTNPVSITANEKTDNEKQEEQNTPNLSAKDNKETEENTTAQNDGTDITDKLSTSIDEILKRKLRRGIPVEN